jgi:hypothetical protein
MCCALENCPGLMKKHMPLPRMELNIAMIAVALIIHPLQATIFVRVTAAVLVRPHYLHLQL